MHFKALLLITALATAGAAQADNLLSNGSFETPNIVASNTYTLYGSGSQAIDGWTVVGGDVQLTPDTFMSLPATEGRQWVDLTGIYGYDKGLVSDSVATVVGWTYTLTFDLGNYVPFGSSSMSVGFNNGPAMTFTNVVNGNGPMDWEHKSLTWTADTNSTRIQFMGVANGGLSNDGVIGLDNVSFTATAPVPEPETYALLLAGLGMVGAMVRRRKNKQA